MRVEQYQNQHKALWDDFAARSKNGTFLVQRDYIEYNRAQLEDFSLIVRDDAGEVLALLPANREGDRLVSRSNLTYGGFITGENMKTARMLAVFDAALAFCQARGLRELIYRVVPHIYHRLPAEEDLYALYAHNARLFSRTVLTVVDSRCRLPFQERRRRGAKKALKHGLTVRFTQDFPAYWALLTDTLRQTYGARPVHTLAEIEALHGCFPRNIRLYAAYQGAQMLGGVVIYESQQVARAQYIAASEAGKALGALDLVFDYLLNDVYAGKPFFDFGSSKEAEGPALNTGLLDQKEGFGGRAVAHDYYALAL